MCWPQRLQRTFAIWIVPVVCAVFGSGFGISRAMLACEAQVGDDQVEQLDTSVEAAYSYAYAYEPCDEDEEAPLEASLADLDGDGSVDGYDLMLFLTEYGLSGPLAGDINGDNSVDTDDFMALVRRLNS